MAKERDAFLQAVALDDTIPIDPEAVELWLKDLENPLRWSVMPLLRLTYSGVVVPDLVLQAGPALPVLGSPLAAVANLLVL